MTMATSSRSTPVALAWVAAATAVFDMVVLAVLHALRTDVDPATDPVSNYAVGDYGTLKVLACSPSGWVRWRSQPRSTRPRGARRWVWCCWLCSAWRRWRRRCVPHRRGRRDNHQRRHPQRPRHRGVLRLPVAAVLLSRSSGRIEMVVAVLLAVAMLAVLAAGAMGGYGGIAQRVSLVLSSTWVLVTAVRLALRQPAPSSGTSPAE